MNSSEKIDSLAVNTKPAENNAEAQYPNAYVPVVPNGKSCALTGLKHAHLYALLKEGGYAAPHVRTLTLKLPGRSRGKLMFHAGDMLRWLDAMAAEQRAPQTRKPAAP